jgi:hypothetical protein
MKLKIFKNPDEQEYAEITQAVKDNRGYCPCSLIRNKNTKCICKEFKEQQNEGYCHCGRFYKKLIDEE